MQRFGFPAGILYGGMPYDKNRPLYLEVCGFTVRDAGFGSDMEAEYGFLRIYTEAMRAIAVRRVLTVQRSAEEYRENVDLIAEGTVLGDGACMELADREAGGRQPMTLYAVHVEKVWYDRGEETGVLNGDVITIHAFPGTRRLANGSRAVFLLEKSQQDGSAQRQMDAGVPAAVRLWLI